MRTVGRFILGLFRKYPNEMGLLIAIVVVLLVTTAGSDAYRAKPGQNAAEILRQTSLLGIFALGAAVVIIAGGIDLSSGAVIAFAGSICAQVLMAMAPLGQRDTPDMAHLGVTAIIFGIAAALVVGFMVGTLHAWMITVLRLPPFIATLASLVGLRSLAKVLNPPVTKALGSQSNKIYIHDPQFNDLGATLWIPLLTFLLLSAAIWFLMNRTVVGRHLYAMGGNEQAARLSGIRTERLKWLAYSISAVTAAIAGVLYTAEAGLADPWTAGQGYELRAIAASVVGGCSLQGGVGLIPGVMLGVLFLRVVIDSVAKLVGTGADDYEGMIVALLIVLAVTFNELRTRAGLGGKQFFPGALGWFAIVALMLLAGAVALVMTGKPVVGVATTVISVLLLGALKLVESRRAV